MAGTVRVIGEVMIDTVAYATAPLAMGSDTPATIAEHHGGSAANVAAWLAHLGVAVELIASVGVDETGQRALAALAEAGVALHVSRRPDLPTGRCVVLVAPDKERTMLPDPGANAVLDPGDIGVDCWTSGDHVHVSGYSLMRPGARRAAVSALVHAQSAGLSISIDASSSAPIAEMGALAFLDLCPPATILLANADEAAALTGETDPMLAAGLLAARGLTAVIKAGPDGAVAARGSHRWRVGAVPTHVTDTTGAGDAFAAGFLASWRASQDIAESLSAATRLAAHAVGTRGARP